MELLPVVLTSGWASGINAYLVVLVLGLIGRFGEVAGIPEGLTRTDVLVVAAALYIVELVADKIHTSTRCGMRSPRRSARRSAR